MRQKAYLKTPSIWKLSPVSFHGFPETRQPPPTKTRWQEGEGVRAGGRGCEDGSGVTFAASDNPPLSVASLLKASRLSQALTTAN